MKKLFKDLKVGDLFYILREQKELMFIKIYPIDGYNCFLFSYGSREALHDKAVCYLVGANAEAIGESGR